VSFNERQMSTRRLGGRSNVFFGKHRVQRDDMARDIGSSSRISAPPGISLTFSSLSNCASTQERIGGKGAEIVLPWHR